MNFRSTLLAACVLLAGCADDTPYFGSTNPPGDDRIVFELHAEPETLDPTIGTLSTEWTVTSALYEGLVITHPETLEPLAGIATHVEADPEQRRFVFFLRGHAQPRGSPLPDRRSLPDDYSRGRSHPPSTEPSRWSDGAPVTADQFVYSWRRLMSPATASPNAVYAMFLKNGEEVNQGRVPLETLGVNARSEFELEVELRAPTAHLLKALWQPFFAPLRREFVEGSADWTRPPTSITNGPFVLRVWKSYDRMQFTPNPGYYDRTNVALDALEIIPVADPASYMNLYKAGAAHITDGINTPKFALRLLSTKRDLDRVPLFYNFNYSINTTRPPFDDVRVRYALNMATDKDAISRLLGTAPAATFVPAVPGYPGPGPVFTTVGGREVDVLQYNPAAARQLLESAGIAPASLTVEIAYTTAPTRLIPEILQQQWQQNLGIRVTPALVENKVLYDATVKLDYAALIESNWGGTYLDPDTFLLRFPTGSLYNGTGWADAAYDRLFALANTRSDAAERMRLLAETEKRLLTGMPIIPVLFDQLHYLRKPYVRGYKGSVLAMPTCFKYVWIDRNWTPGS